LKLEREGKKIMTRQL